MSKQQKTQQYVYKINSSLLRRNNWDLTLPLNRARSIPGMVVSLADSQVLSWINELNGTENYDVRAKDIRRQIKDIKKMPSTKSNKRYITDLYEQLYKIQFKEDYVCIIMDKKSDYDRANKGFYINGILYKRLICTANGVKTSTVVYVSDRIHGIIKKRIENGRNTEIPLVPAKLGAYESLVASASSVVSWPKDRHAKIPGGVIVVKDCYTEFKADLINIDGSDSSKEPIVEFVKDQVVKNNCSDGCSMMLPSLSRRWNGELEGDYDRTMSGCNLRCAWTKGMTFTFDFIEFAETVMEASVDNPEPYFITDAWGHRRDIRDAELIITESQLKLWSCYSSWEDFYEKCIENKYTIRVAKTAPHELDDIRQLNYQFIQSLDLPDDDIEDLISPTVNEIKDIMGLDPKKSIVYLCGKGLDDKAIEYADPCAKALMVDNEVISDPYIRGRIKKMIHKRIREAKIGVLDVHGNFQIISGDLYALCESIWGLPVRGLLSAGEIYSKYWIDQDVKRVMCARAPMSNAHSLISQDICFAKDAQYWFRYMDTVVVVNAWDTMAMALNGFDYDGDLVFTTDNQPLMRNQTNLPALNCLQRNADKKKVDDEDLIRANKNGFGSKIGSITNKITAITSLMCNFSSDSDEYKELKYRTQCGQALQQEEIDKVKGIIPTPMPKEWYDYHTNFIKDDDSDKVIAKKKFNQRICAFKKPYFFGYNYPSLKAEYDKQMSEINSNLKNMFCKTYEEMKKSDNLTDTERDTLNAYSAKICLDMSPSTMNRICWAIESHFDHQIVNDGVNTFSYQVYKSDADYSYHNFIAVMKVCREYEMQLANLSKESICGNGGDLDKTQLVEMLHAKCSAVCPNEKELCDILLDLCYGGTLNKSIVWTLCGHVIVDNLLAKNNMQLTYPMCSNKGYLCCGSRFTDRTITVGGNSYNQV